MACPPADRRTGRHIHPGFHAGVVACMARTRSIFTTMTFRIWVAIALATAILSARKLADVAFRAALRYVRVTGIDRRTVVVSSDCAYRRLVVLHIRLHGESIRRRARVTLRARGGSGCRGRTGHHWGEAWFCCMCCARWPGQCRSSAGWACYWALPTITASVLVGRFFSGRRPSRDYPGVTVAKPLHGDEWQLVHLESFFVQNYPGWSSTCSACTTRTTRRSWPSRRCGRATLKRTSRSSPMRGSMGRTARSPIS